MDQVEEVLPYLQSPRADVRKQATEVVLALTGTDGGIVTLHAAKLLEAKGGQQTIVEILAKLVLDSDDTVAQNAVNSLVNMTTNERIREEVIELESFWKGYLEVLARLYRVRDTEKVSPLLCACIKLLTNISTTLPGSQRYILGRLGVSDPAHKGLDLKILLHAFWQHSSEIPEAALVLTNVTRLEDGRAILVGSKYFEKLPPLLESDNATLRRGVIDTIKNCCFEVDKHKFIVKKTLTVEYFLRCLIGPEGITVDEDSLEEFPELLRDAIENSESFERESDEDTRRSIVDTLMLLCTTQTGRVALRMKKSYDIIKAYHGEETNEDTNEVIFKLVDYLLRDEEEEVEAEEIKEDEVEAEEIKEDEEELKEPVKAEVVHKQNEDGAIAPEEMSSVLFEVD